MTLVVTGAAGFIGSNLVKALNLRGDTDIIAVDDLTDGPKYRNLVDCDIADYLDKDDFLARLKAGDYTGKLRAILHQGACSDTMEHNGKYMMANNYQYTLNLFDWCQDHGVPLLYASSAAVYGAGRVFSESREHEAPLNVYGYSKFLFDQVVRRRFDQRRAQVVGFRYFNVYGPREAHKGRMASVAFHLHRQLLAEGRVRLFGASHGYAPGEQRRDFVHVDDVVDVTLWCAAQPPAVSGVYNCGSGRAEPFNAVARAVLDFHGRGTLDYIDFPADLVDAYQAFTEADLTRLRAAGYAGEMRDVARGVREYLSWLAS